MVRLKVGLLVVLIIIAGYGMHKLIAYFIKPAQSVNHRFLYFLAHFLGIFVLSILVNLFILYFAKFWFST